jgi:hypothetical protein
MEEAFEEGQGPHRAVEPVMMMTHNLDFFGSLVFGRDNLHPMDPTEYISLFYLMTEVETDFRKVFYPEKGL